MEVDGIDADVSIEKPTTNTSFTNNADLVTKNVSSFSDNKEYDNMHNNDDLSHSQPPNGEQEIPDEVPYHNDTLEGEQIDQQAPNVNPQSHLESNISVIENQNNENMERDNVLMEFETTEPVASSMHINSAIDREKLVSSKEDADKRINSDIEISKINLVNCENSSSNNEVPKLSYVESIQTSDSSISTEPMISLGIHKPEQKNQDNNVSVDEVANEIDPIDVIPTETELLRHGETNQEVANLEENPRNESVVYDELSSETVTSTLVGAVESSTENIKETASNDGKHEVALQSPNAEKPLKSVESDVDAPVLDDVDSIDNSQGSDEAITIIPDSEREITEAEKKAASSLPTLKDIAEQSEPSEATDVPESDSTDNELQIYKYDGDTDYECHQCKKKKDTKYYFSNSEQELTYICDDPCLNSFKSSTSKTITMVTEEGSGLRVKNFTEGEIQEPAAVTFLRTCPTCNKVTDDIDTNLTWEIMDFCNQVCLSKYQKLVGAKCTSCSGDVKSSSLGKYCVRFGNDIRQFCSSACLEQYKKGLKVCSYCQQEMSNGPDGFLAPVGEKGQFKDFCSKICLEKYDIMTNDRPPKAPPGTTCSVCKEEKPITIEFEHNDAVHYFCGEHCLVAFVFVNKISPGKCAMCKRNFKKSTLEQHTMYYDNAQFSFCSNSCKNIYIIAHRKIVPCSWCKVKKYNFDMIKKYSKTDNVINTCSINCLNMYQLSLSAINPKPAPCGLCKKMSNSSYHLTMSDASMRSFCSYRCVMNFQNQFPKQISLNNMSDPIPTGGPLRTKRVTSSDASKISQLPVISNVQSLANSNGNGTGSLIPAGLTPISSTRLTRSKATTSTSGQQSTVPNVQNLDLPVQVQVKQQYIIQEKPCPDQRNVAIMCQPKKGAKGTQVTPTTRDACIQTDKDDVMKIIVPIPVPIYVPTPCHMFATPVPFPVPFPLPVPIPIFIPTTRNSAAGIMKEIKKIQVKIPTDPYEAEVLMMAEMVAGEKKEDHTDSESDLDENGGEGGEYSPEGVDSSNTFGDDMLQMALKMATELDEPAVDLEGALTANTITAPSGAHPPDGHPPEENVDDPQPMNPHLMERSPLRGRKRSMRGSGTPRGSQSKRGRRMSQQVDMPMMQPVPPSAPPEPQEKPDANMCLKYTFGVNAWKQWVTTKNAELEKSTRRMKLFKTEILQLTADELNYSLCLFVKEVRKPNGQEYAPDTIYYLCLGIQQYLFENGRIDNIFCDPYYEKFTDCLDEVAKKFSVLYNDSHYIVTRVEEEHLWESKQLGAHSPHVLLSTLMFFNTKHFNLTTVDEHMQLSFSHIMKHWKRNPNQPGASKVPGSRNVLLRFYPPQSALQNNQRKKKVYEQQENEENPLRCPVKLYEFYLSKCPESVKTRNDVFYLQPERSCVPDSPVWYSTMPLPKEALEKMLHRVKMVKEINVALLTS